MSRSNTHCEIYEEPELYELAFSYRDIDAEVAFLEDLFVRHVGAKPSSFLELAAGPAAHARAFAARGSRALALDLEPRMSAFATSRAASSGLNLTCINADMRDFRVDAPVDYAATMLCSATYLLSDDDWIAHLCCVAEALRPGGAYLLELPHPAEAHDPRTSHEWTIERGDDRLYVQWCSRSDDDDPFLKHVRAAMDYKDPHGAVVTTVESRAQQRVLSQADLHRIVANSGRFTVACAFGAFEHGVPVDDPEAWRLIVLLLRTSQEHDRA